MKLKKNTKVTFAELPGTDLHAYYLIRKDAEPKELTGVTTMLKKLGITQGYSFVKRDVLARAAARGTAIHELLQGYEMNEPVNSTIHFEWDCEDGSHKSEDEDCSQMLRTSFSCLPQNVQDTYFGGKWENWRNELELAAGYYEAVFSLSTKKMEHRHKSISFGSMSEEEFSELYDNVVNLAWTIIGKYVTPEIFEQRLANF